jgi:hypothetical protein
MANVTSSIKLRRATGSATDAPGNGALQEGELALNLINGKLFYGTRFGFNVSSSFTVDYFTASYVSISSDLTVKDLTVTNTASITYFKTIYKTSSIIEASGSTFFGDTIDDVHYRTGSMFISGGLTMAKSTSISASVVTASHLFVSGMDNRAAPDLTPSAGSGWLKSGSLRVDGPVTFHNSTLGSASIFSTQSTPGGAVDFVISGNLVLERNSHNAGVAATASLPRIESSHISASIISASEYFGVTKTKYQTGSTPQEDLLNLKILDFDPNVFVFSDPVTGQLTLQFGQASLPTVTLKTTGGTFLQETSSIATVAPIGDEVLVSTDFVTNRFNLQSQSSFVFTSSITDIPASVEILSCSLFVNDNKVTEYKSGSDSGFPTTETFDHIVYEVTAPNSIIGTNQPPLSGNPNPAGAQGRLHVSRAGGGLITKTIGNHQGLTTGSGYVVKTRWTVKDGTGTIQNIEDSHTFNLNKTDPTQTITLTPSYTNLEGGSEFVSSSNNVTFIENGITGSISYTTNSMDNVSNLWVFQNTTATKTNPFDLEETGSNFSLQITANYTDVGSPGTSSVIGLGGIPDRDRNAFATISSGSESGGDSATRTTSRTYKRVTSIRTFCSPTSSFTEQQLWDIKGAWTSSVFSASINKTGGKNPNGYSFTQPIPAEADHPAGLYVWIVYSGSYNDLTGITQNDLPAFANWSKVHDYPTYKAYRTNLLNGQDAGSTYVLTI